MAKRYVAGVPCWVDVASPEPRATADFYRDLFGWVIEDRAPAAPGGAYLWAQLDGEDVAGIGAPATSGATTTSGATRAGTAAASWRTYVRVTDLDATAARVAGAGGTLVTAAFAVPEPGRAALFADPAGAVLGVWEPSEHPGAQRVNEANTWNFNTLRTPDPDGAKRFYAAVFGWEPRLADFGAATATMWCLPGYGEQVEREHPGWMQGHADRGSPPGFVDVVGWLEALPVDTPGGGPAWGVELTVDDTRATTRRALTLGARVEVAPFDAGGLWSAVLRDPQGAVFALNDFGQGSA